MLSREQVRAARAARGWGVRDLAEAAGKPALSFATISAFENGADSRKGTLDRIEATLKAQGFKFFNNGDLGVSWDAGARERWAAADKPKPSKPKARKGKRSNR